MLLNINNKNFELSVKPDEFLVDTLRKLGFSSVKRGCDTSSCGACAIWVDCKVILSCNYLSIRASGKKIVTLEGVQKESKELGGFLADEGADQCGYCAPGFLMTVLGLEREIENPSEEDIYKYLQGNLCRCTGYKGQIRGVRKYFNWKQDRGE